MQSWEDPTLLFSDLYNVMIKCIEFFAKVGSSRSSSKLNRSQCKKDKKSVIAKYICLNQYRTVQISAKMFKLA